MTCVDTTYGRTHLLGRRADYVRPFPHLVSHRRRQYYIIIIMIVQYAAGGTVWELRVGLYSTWPASVCALRVPVHSPLAVGDGR